METCHSVVKCWMYLGTCVNTMQEGRAVYLQYLLLYVQPVTTVYVLPLDEKYCLVWWNAAHWLSSDCGYKLQWAQKEILARMPPFWFYFHFTPHAIELRRSLQNYTALNWTTPHTAELRRILRNYGAPALECGVAQLVVGRLAVRQARVRCSALEVPLA